MKDNHKTSAWQSFLDEVFNHNQALITEVQILLGRALKQSLQEG